MTSGTWDRHRGHEDSYDVVDIGFNFRLDEPRAALGLSRLPKVEREIEQRRACVRAYRERLGNAMWDDVDRAAPLRVRRPVRRRRDAREGARGARRASASRRPAIPALHELTEFARYATGLPNAEAAAERHLALPLSAHTTLEQVETRQPGGWQSRSRIASNSAIAIS